MAINYKNVVSIQRSNAGNTHAYSGFTLANAGVAATDITSPADIIKHKGFILVPTGATGPLSVFPTYFGADGLTLTGVTLTAGGALGTQYPLEVPLRMKNFVGLTGGSILFVV